MSREEGALLWQQAQESYEKGDFASTAVALRRFVHRYPGHEGYLQAHYYLGHCELELGKPYQAVAPLKHFLQASRGPKGQAVSENPSTVSAMALARVWLGKANLALLKYGEAYLLSQEIEKSPAAPHHQGMGLILRARALLGQNHLSRAERAIEAATPLLKASPPQTPFVSQSLAEIAWLKLVIKNRSCNLIIGNAPQDETLVHDRMDQRAVCLREALVLYRQAMILADTHWSQPATQEINGNISSFQKLCNHPPNPKTKRTAAELKRYRTELTSYLKRQCSAQFGLAADMIQDWEKELTQPSALTMHKGLVTTLRKLAAAPEE